MSLIKTINKPASALISDRGSKFYAYAYPIEKKEQVKLLIDKLKVKHPKANHFCTAFSIGHGEQEYHLSNDDGEPANSAGAPILGQIRSFQLSNILIVVIRYFGGTKLGIRGLINAYKTAAKEAINTASIKEEKIMASFSFAIPYERMGAILSIIDKNKLKAAIEHSTHEAKIEITVDKDFLPSTLQLFQAFNLTMQIN